MSFHSKDCAKYVESGQSLCDKMLESVAEYFKNIFNLQVANGSLAEKCKCQIEYCAKRKLRCMLEKRYKEKIHCIADQRHGDGGRHGRQSRTYYCQDYMLKGCNHSHCRHDYDKRKKKQEDKILSDRGNKAFKPCPSHGPKSNLLGADFLSKTGIDVKYNTGNIEWFDNEIANV